MSQPPVWLLDVDGVINAARPGWSAAPHRADVWSPTDHCQYPLRWAPTLVDRIRALHVAKSVEVRWCTTWCPDADQLERLWRFPPLDRALAENPVPKGSYGWPLKLAAARKVLASGRRLVWTDDEAVPPDGPDRDELVQDGRALLIAPSPRRGLQPDDLVAIEAFLSGAATEDS
ncbi:hypothetical protein GCM10027290_44810 [Micromonospora sonneratiae]|uniref:Secreted protein n=1 Tax=Micromonospora sonneratiae TaxID=1184706 RepID=A0ABW3Y6U1_9ACTN